MKAQRVQSHKVRNIVQSILLLGGMAVLLMLMGWVVAGGVGVLVAGAAVILLASSQRVSPQMIFRMYRGRLLTPAVAPELFRIAHALAQRAELPVVPRLYYIPSAMMNAFTVGQPHNAAIGVTDGLLRRLTRREIAGVLAHEIAHIHNRDTWVMGLADVVSRTTVTCSTVGQILLLISIPSILLSHYQPPWLLFILLIIAPTLSALLQLGLSRTREYDADLEAVRLTGDPQGLASALSQLEQYQQGFFERIFLPGRRQPNPSWLRTHPAISERIERLGALSGAPPQPHRSSLPHGTEITPLTIQMPQVVRAPRWRPIGFVWY